MKVRKLLSLVVWTRWEPFWIWLTSNLKDWSWIFESTNRRIEHRIFYIIFLDKNDNDDKDKCDRGIRRGEMLNRFFKIIISLVFFSRITGFDQVSTPTNKYLHRPSSIWKRRVILGNAIVCCWINIKYNRYRKFFRNDEFEEFVLL